MTALAEYLLKANLCLAGFYALYYGLLRRHTFFTLNRVYLLTALVASFVLPLISLPEPVVQTVSLPVIIDLPATVVTTQSTGPTLEDMLLIVYGAGTLLFLSLLIVSLWRLMRLIRSGKATRQSDHTLVLLPDERVAPFSFFRYLVLNQADFAQHADPIVGHELAHIRQWHSVDVLLAEGVKVICWLNPVAWLYKRSLQQVHEYLADQQATDKARYARFLFDYAFQTEPSPVVNSFLTPALLTRRIRMLYQSRNTSRALWKYALVLPLVAVLVGLTAAREPMTRLIQADQSTGDSGLTRTGLVTGANGQPMMGAHVRIGGTSRLATTDEQGHFTLTDVANTASLIVTFVGYKTVQIPVDDVRVFSVNLSIDPKNLAEAVVKREQASLQGAAIAVAPVSTTTPPDEIFTVVEQNPEFPGGTVALGQYLGANIRYPDKARQQHTEGKVFVQFVVGIDGSIQNPRVLKGIGNGCDEEALRVTSAMPNWKPGKQSGRPVNVQFNLPIRFSLGEGKPSGRSAVIGSQPQSFSSLQPGTYTGLVMPSNPFSSEKPLVFIDGEEQPREYDPNSIRPNDIQSIDVLKGESAKPYGEKGKNGVIQITTKAKKP